MSRRASVAWREGLLWKGYGLVALALTGAYFLLGGNDVAQAAIYQLFVVAAPVAILVGLKRYRPARSRHWLLFAGGLVLWCVGETYWTSYVWVLGEQAPYPSFADAAFLGGYPLLIAGVFVLARGGSRPRIGDLLDGAIVSLAAGVVTVLFFLKPLLATTDSAFAKLIAVGFPVVDVVLLVAFTQLMFSGRVPNFALRAFMVGAGALLVSDAAYSYLSLDGAYTSGMIIDAGWLACYGLWGLAALHPSMAAIRSLGKHEAAGLSFWRIGALLAAMLAAPVVLVSQTSTVSGEAIEHGEIAIIGAVIIATTLLVGARVGLLQREGKKVRAALGRSDERFKLAQGVAGVGTWSMDLTTREVEVSDSLAELIGAPGAQPTYDDWVAFIHPDDRERVMANFTLARDQGDQYEHEYRFRRPDGGEGWVFTRGQAFLENGVPVRAFGVAVDITARHAMEGQVMRSEEGMRLAQELGGIGTWDADLETGITTWSKNMRRISGVDDDAEITHEFFIQLVHPDDRAGLEAALAKAVEYGGHFEFEYRLVRRNDDEVRWMLSRGDAVTGPDGHSIRFLGVAVDITERHDADENRTKLEHQLREAHKLEAVGRLAGGVAHDFNNILLAIRGNGELALDALKHGESSVEEDVKEMIEAADRAAALTTQLLAFSRRQVLQAEVLDLNEVVREMDKLLRRMIGEDVELKAVVAEEPIHVSADRSQIEQVIANLAVNARDAMGDGGVLTLEATTTEIESDQEIDLAPGRYAMLIVSDTGRGMDSVTLARIFEPFFTTKAEGTGFGLSTVHGIVVQSGGSIWVYSEVEHGTTFKIFLPLAEQAQSLESRLPEQAANLTVSAGETILLVEDDAHVMRIVRNILNRLGYRVLAAGGAEEALRIAAEESEAIHLLLSDLVMPGTSGRELAQQVQALRPDISILYMSGYTDDAVIRRGVLEAGMAFIQKPFGAEDLARRVREVLDGHENRTVAA